MNDRCLHPIGRRYARHAAYAFFVAGEKKLLADSFYVEHRNEQGMVMAVEQPNAYYARFEMRAALQAAASLQRIRYHAEALMYGMWGTRGMQAALMFKAGQILEANGLRHSEEWPENVTARVMALAHVAQGLQNRQARAALLFWAGDLERQAQDIIETANSSSWAALAHYPGRLAALIATAVRALNGYPQPRLVWGLPLLAQGAH